MDSGPAPRGAPRNDRELSVTPEAVVPIVIPAAAAMAVIGNAEHALDRADGSADAGADSASDHAAHRAADAVAFIASLLCAAHHALGVAGLRQGRERKKDRGACQAQAKR